MALAFQVILGWILFSVIGGIIFFLDASKKRDSKPNFLQHLHISAWKYILDWCVLWAEVIIVYSLL